MFTKKGGVVAQPLLAVRRSDELATSALSRQSDAHNSNFFKGLLQVLWIPEGEVLEP
jgi:hypothetical protein